MTSFETPTFSVFGCKESCLAWYLGGWCWPCGHDAELAADSTCSLVSPQHSCSWRTPELQSESQRKEKNSLHK